MASDITVTAANVRRINPSQDRVVPVTLAETVTAGQVLYQTTSGAFGVADANVAAKAQPRGIALQGGGAGEVVDLLAEGEVEGFTLTSLDYDAVLYLSDTAGALNDAAGSVTAAIARVAGDTSKDRNKFLYVFCDWCTVYS